MEAHIPRYFKKVEKRREEARKKAAEEAERQAMKDKMEAFRKKKEVVQKTNPSQSTLMVDDENTVNINTAKKTVELGKSITKRRNSAFCGTRQQKKAN